MSKKYYINLSIIILAMLLFSGCSKDRHIDFKVADQHLEQHTAGRWLTTFNVDYNQGQRSIKKQILEKLHNHGKLIEKYSGEESANVITTFIWDYQGKTIKEEY